MPHPTRFVPFVLAALAATVLVAGGAPAAAQPTLDALAAAQLPSWARPVVEDPAFAARYLPDPSLNPFLQSADFDRDGALEVALLVFEVDGGRRGVALLRRGDPPRVLGAGDATSPGGADWSWLRVWHVEPRLPAGAALAPAGDALVLSALDGARLWVFRDADGWRWTVP